MLSIFNKKKNIVEKDDLVNTSDAQFFEKNRKNEYSRLDENNQVYLDFTGGNLYAQSQLDEHFSNLKKNVLGNPHSTNPSSILATQQTEEARKKVLQFFNATDDYFCVFTANASNALKIVGESYPFDKDGCYLLLSDNHNSVNGIREYARSKGASYDYAPIHFEDLMIDEQALLQKLSACGDKKNKLFAYPAQSNVSGIKHSLEWIKKAQDLGWDVLLDAAAFVPTSKLDLKKITPDFISVSFYKIFGFPTGIGCLLIRKSKFEKLCKPWFAGGTVTLVSIGEPHHFLAHNHERFEDGTINYLEIPAITIGLNYIEKIGIKRINKRISSLAIELYNRLSRLKHSNGADIVKIFGPTDRSLVGGNLILVILDKDGNRYDFNDVEEKANKKKISIRSGCFCNPGVDEANNCISSKELSKYFSSRNGGDYKDMMNFLGKLRGANRVSVGIATNQADIDTFVKFIEDFKDV